MMEPMYTHIAQMGLQSVALVCERFALPLRGNRTSDGTVNVVIPEGKAIASN